MRSLFGRHLCNFGNENAENFIVLAMIRGTHRMLEIAHKRIILKIFQGKVLNPLRKLTLARCFHARV